LGEHEVEQRRARTQLVGEPRRAAHDLGDEAEQMRIGMAQREQLHARWQPRHVTVEIDEGGLGVGRASERAQQRGHQFGQQFARAGAAHAAVAAVMPGTDLA
ncbi:MAG: hypothetical protein ACK559_26900, partial [bacterium]